jgi:hypothetical protein
MFSYSWAAKRPASMVAATSLWPNSPREITLSISYKLVRETGHANIMILWEQWLETADADGISLPQWIKKGLQNFESCIRKKDQSVIIWFQEETPTGTIHTREDVGFTTMKVYGPKAIISLRKHRQDAQGLLDTFMEVLAMRLRVKVPPVARVGMRVSSH